MHRFPVVLMMTLITSSALAQMSAIPRASHPVKDPAMVVENRGSEIEIFPNQRARDRILASGKRINHEIYTAPPSATISPRSLGVIFNHTLQERGFITGEIAFKMNDDLQPTQDFNSVDYPRLSKLTDPNVYVVVAKTPIQFIQVLKRLQARNDLEWVEPVIAYGSASDTVSP